MVVEYVTVSLSCTIFETYIGEVTCHSNLFCGAIRRTVCIVSGKHLSRYSKKINYLYFSHVWNNLPAPWPLYGLSMSFEGHAIFIFRHNEPYKAIPISLGHGSKHQKMGTEPSNFWAVPKSNRLFSTKTNSRFKISWKFIHKFPSNVHSDTAQETSSHLGGESSRRSLMRRRHQSIEHQAVVFAKQYAASMSACGTEPDLCL